MNTSSLRKGMLATIGALMLAGGSSAARADDMGGMKMDKAKMEHEKADPGRKATKEPAMKGAEKLDIAVTDKGFEPDKVTVKKGELVELVFTRKTDQTCIKEVVLDTGGSEKIQKPLPLNKPVSIKTKFTKTGDLKYACSMNMFSGIVTVR